MTSLILVLEGGRVGTELRAFAVPEIAAVACDGDDPMPEWALSAPSLGASTAVVPNNPSVISAVRRCALTRLALEPIASGSPETLAASLCPHRVSHAAVVALAPGRHGASRHELERVGGALRAAGFGTALHPHTAAIAIAIAAPMSPISPPECMVYLLPERTLCTVAAWGGGGGHGDDAPPSPDTPNAMPPEQATVCVNMARVSRGDTVWDPCVGGGAILAAAVKAGAAVVLGSDIDLAALTAADDALRRWSGATMEPHTRKRKPTWSCHLALSSVTHQQSPWCESVVVDVIATDLPYGRRAALADDESPAAMLRGLFHLARLHLAKHTGRIAAWLQRWDADDALQPSRVAAEAAACGFEVETTLGEDRKSGTARALYVFRWASGGRGWGKKGTHGGSGGRWAREEEDDDDAAQRASQAMHCALRRGEKYIPACGDIWRAAWVGDLLAVEAALRAGTSVVHAVGAAQRVMRCVDSLPVCVCPSVAGFGPNVFECAGRRHTPLECAAGKTAQFFFLFSLSHAYTRLA